MVGKFIYYTAKTNKKINEYMAKKNLGFKELLAIAVEVLDCQESVNLTV
jgi:hypothetical protein